MDAELIADAVLLADPVQRDPRAGRVRDVVVPVVARRPARHRALLDPVGQPARFGRLQQRHELRFEIEEVLVHAVLLVAPDEAADGIDAEQHRGVEHAQHELVLLPAHRRVVVQHVVEIPDVRQADAVRLQRGLDAARTVLVERPAQIERVRDRIEHRLGRDVGFAGMQRGRQLDVAGVQLPRELDPVFDRAIGIGIPDRARRQLLQRRREHAHLHELRLKRSDRHDRHLIVGARPPRGVVYTSPQITRRKPRATELSRHRSAKRPLPQSKRPSQKTQHAEREDAEAEHHHVSAGRAEDEEPAHSRDDDRHRGTARCGTAAPSRGPGAEAARRRRSDR